MYTKNLTVKVTKFIQNTKSNCKLYEATKHLTQTNESQLLNFYHHTIHLVYALLSLYEIWTFLVTETQ